MLIIIVNRMLIGEELMYGLDLFFNEVKEWIDPKKYAAQLKENYVCRVLLLHVEKFMPENLLTFPTINIEPAVPKDRSEKGKGSTWFCSVVQFKIVDTFTGVPV